MCGILGFASATSVDYGKWISRVIHSLSHRGPDNQGILNSSKASTSFGHTRLAILELSSAGNQPMLSSCGRFMISFNGEIYNHIELREELSHCGHSFNSRSDTETLLACFQEWGTACFNKLKGMFAVAIFDNESRKLYLARDISGEKPLFYFFNSTTQTIFFSSELKQLLQAQEVSKNTSSSQLIQYLMYGYTSQSSSLVSGCLKLPPASYLEYSLETLSLNISAYWSPPSRSLSFANRDKYLTSQFDAILVNSVQRQLNADVPAAILLSGGLDSSLITAIASRVSDKRISTFNVSFNSDAYNESHYAEHIASYYNTDHICVHVNENSADSIQYILNTIDEPIADSSLLPTFLVCKEISKDFKVALGGDGSDELFGGYRHYNMIKFASIIRKLTNAKTKRIANKFLNQFPLGTRGKNLLESLFYNRINMKAPLLPPSLFSPLDIQKLFDTSTEIVIDGILDCFSNIPASATSSSIETATYHDFTNYLPGNILTKVDRMSMLNSLEMRSPFLDKDVINFAFSCLAPAQKVNFTDRKIFLKRFAQTYLPPDFNFERKQGFSIPLNQWIATRGPIRDYFMDTLISSNSFFSKKYVSRLVTDQLNHGKSNSHRLFCLLALSQWLSANQISLKLN